MIFFQILFPEFIAPFIVSWLTHKFRARNFWSYLITLILCLVYPYVLLETVHLKVKDGAAHAGLVVVPVLAIPLTMLFQFLANMLFDNFGDKKNLN